MNIRPAQLVMFVVAMIVAGLLVLPKSREVARWEESGGDLYKIIARYERAIELRPRDYDARRKLAFYLSEVTSFDRAEQLLVDQLQIHREGPKAWRHLARLKWRLQDTEGAAEGWRNGYDPKAWTEDEFEEVVDRLFWMKDTIALIQVFGQARGSGQKLGPYRVQQWAWALETRGQHEQAVPLRVEAARRLMSDVEAWNHLVDLYQFLENEEAELETRKRWEALGDKSMGLEFAVRLGDLDRHAEKEALLWKLIRRWPHDADPALALVDFAFERGEPVVGRVLPKYMEAWPSDADTMVAFAEWLVGHVREKEARVIYERALVVLGDSTEPEYRLRRADIHLALGNPVRAISDLEDLLEDFPIEARKLLVYAYGDTNRPQQALKTVDRLLEIASSTEMRMARAGLLTQLGELDLALSAWTELHEFVGPSETIFSGLVSIHLDRGNLTSAGAWLATWGTTFPKSRRVDLFRARFLLQSGRNQEAFALLKNLDTLGELTTTELRSQYLLVALQVDDPGVEKNVQDFLEQTSGIEIRLAYAEWLNSRGRSDDMSKTLEVALVDLRDRLDPGSRFQRARIEKMMGRREVAVALYEGLVESHPREARVALVDLYAIEGRPDRALEIAEHLLADRRDAGTVLITANLLAGMGRYPEAIKRFEEVITLGRTDVIVVNGLASSWLELGRVDRAREWVERLERDAPGSREASWLRIRLKLVDGDRLGALADLKALSGHEAFAANREWHLTLAFLSLELQDKETEHHVTAFFKEFTDDVDLRISWGIYLRDRKRDAEADKQFARAMAMLPQGPLSAQDVSRRAEIFAWTGKLREAVVEFEKQKSNQPIVARRRLLDLYERLGDPVRLEATMAELAELDPDRNLLMSWGALLYASGDITKALERWQRVDRVYGPDMEALTLLAEHWLDRGDITSATQWVNRLRTEYPEAIVTVRLRARLAVVENHMAEALALLSALSMDQLADDVLARRLFVELSLEQETTNAEDLAWSFLKDHRNDVPVLESFGRWLRARGRDDDAERMLGRALDALRQQGADRLQRARLMVLLNRAEPALALIEELLEAHPIAARRLLIEAHVQMKHPDLALDVAEDLYEEAPTRDHHRLLADLNQQAGHTMSAIMLYEESLQRWGPERDVLAAVVYGWLDLKKPAKAHDAFERLENHSPRAVVTRRLKAGFLVAEGHYEKAYDVLAPLAVSGSLEVEDTLWPETLVLTGRWMAGLQSWRIINNAEPQYEWKWWGLRDPREIYEDQVDAELSLTDGPGSQSVLAYQHWYSTFINEWWRFELGQSWTSWEDSAPRVTNVNALSHWLGLDWRWRHDRVAKGRIGLDHLDSDDKFSGELIQESHESWTDWSVSYRLGIPREVLEVVRFDGRESRWRIEARQPLPDQPFSVYEGFEIWDWSIDREKNTVTNSEDIGDGQRWWVGFEWPLTTLEYSEQPNYYITYQYTQSVFKATSPGILNLIPVVEKQRDHGIAFHAFHRWDSKWEWLGRVGLNVDDARSEEIISLGTKWRYRTSESGRFGVGVEYSSEASSASGGSVLQYVLDGQWLF